MANPPRKFQFFMVAPQAANRLRFRWTSVTNIGTRRGMSCFDMTLQSSSYPSTGTKRGLTSAKACIENLPQRTLTMRSECVFSLTSRCDTNRVRSGGQALLIKVKLDGQPYKEKQHVAINVNRPKKSTDGKMKACTMKQVQSFLEEHTTAKILIVVSTHCMDDSGFFVWGGSSIKHKFDTCLLDSVGVLGRLLLCLLTG
jgi:hypothetical protein